MKVKGIYMFKGFLLGVFLVLSTTCVVAFEISMNREDIIVGKINQMNVKIVNYDSMPIALEASVAQRRYTIDGVETLDDTTEDILVVPSQIILGPNESQFVALRWVGSADITSELPFRLMVENIPIDITSANVKQPVLTGQIRMTYRLVRGFYVRPEGSLKSKLVVTKSDYAKRKSTEKGVADSPALEVVISNAGDAHQIVRSATLAISIVDSGSLVSAQTATVNYGGQDFDGGINFLPKEDRRIMLPWPKGLPVLKERQRVVVSILKFSEE